MSKVTDTCEERLKRCVHEEERLKGPVRQMSQETGEMCTACVAVRCSVLQCVLQCVAECERLKGPVRQMSKERPTAQM